MPSMKLYFCLLLTTAYLASLSHAQQELSYKEDHSGHVREIPKRCLIISEADTLRDSAREFYQSKEYTKASELYQQPITKLLA